VLFNPRPRVLVSTMMRTRDVGKLLRPVEERLN